jgi:uncharacterized cupin superfamily protein
MPKLDLGRVPVKTGSIYPPPFAAQTEGRRSLRLGHAGGLTQFGVTLVILEPGARSSHRHWHRSEDEVVMVLQGTLTPLEDTGEAELGPGDCAVFPAGVANGHCLLDRTAAVGRFLVAGTTAPHAIATYSDVDLVVEIRGGEARFTRKNGTPIGRETP